jgi:two-component system response regulator NreC
MSIRILIADDHGVVRAGLRALLNAEPDLEVVGEATSGQEALRLAGELRPDMVLLDISMPDPDGLEVTRRLKELLPDVLVLILTVHEDGGLLQGAIRAGAAGYIIKQAVDSELINAVYTIWSGERYVYPTMVPVLLESLSSPVSSEPPEKLLTPREIEVLSFVAQGYTNRQIAEVLCISVRTVEGYRANMMRKLKLHDRVELTRYAMESGLLR